MSITADNGSFETFNSWAMNEANIEAPKVRLLIVGSDHIENSEPSSSTSSERGLFSCDVIHPYERIMFIPSASLIGSKTNLNDGEDHAVPYVDENGTASHPDMDSKRLMELDSIFHIKSIRKMVERDETWGEWRDDDGVALYLMACETIISMKEEATSKYDQATASRVHDPIHSHDITDSTISAAAASLPPSFLPHVFCLPKTFPSCPLCYSQEELHFLEGTNCHGYTTRMKHQIQGDWERLRHILDAYYQNVVLPGNRQRQPSWEIIFEDEMTIETYTWALICIFSRSSDFLPATEGEEGSANGAGTVTRVIAPFMDMINHDFESEITHSMDSQGNVEIFNGSKQIEPNAQLFLNYGNFPNEKLLLVYGFTIHDNPFDAVQLYAPISPDDPMYTAKARILREHCGVMDPNLPYALIGKNHGHDESRASEEENNEHHLENGPVTSTLPSSLLSALRLIGVTTAEEMASLIIDDINHEVSVIHPVKEQAALSALESALDGMLRRLGLNLITDETLEGVSVIAASEAEVQEEKSIEGQCNVREVNLTNARILCESEYRILMNVLTDVRNRLVYLDETTY